jgi:hypothetical protein
MNIMLLWGRSKGLVLRDIPKIVMVLVSGIVVANHQVLKHIRVILIIMAVLALKHLLHVRRVLQTQHVLVVQHLHVMMDMKKMPPEPLVSRNVLLVHISTVQLVLIAQIMHFVQVVHRLLRVLRGIIKTVLQQLVLHVQYMSVVSKHQTHRLCL